MYGYLAFFALSVWEIFCTFLFVFKNFEFWFVACSHGMIFATYLFNVFDISVFFYFLHVLKSLIANDAYIYSLAIHKFFLENVFCSSVMYLYLRFH